MKSGLVLTALLATCRCAAGETAPSKLDWIAVAKRTEPAVAQLHVYNQAGKEIATGNGFFVAADGKLLTDFYLLEKAANVMAVLENGEWLTADGVLATDTKNDLALLKFPVSNQTYLSLAVTGLPALGQRVAVIRSPWAATRTPKIGVVVAVRTVFGDIRRIQLKAGIDSEAGGAPVVDGTGTVIGSIRTSVRDPRLFNFAIPAAAAGKLLARAGAQPIPFRPQHKSGDAADVELFLTEEWRDVVAAFLLADWDQLLFAAQSLTHRFPTYAEGYACIGTACVELKLYDRATAAFRHVIQLEPENPVAWINLGINYDAQDKENDAVAAYRQVLKLKPNSEVAWSKLGAIYCRQGKYGDAISAWQEVIRLEPRDPVAWANLGVNNEAQGKWDEAIAAYCRAVQLEPDYPFAWIRLGVDYGQLGRHNDARAAHRHAFELKTDFPILWLSLDISSIVRAQRAVTEEKGDLPLPVP